MWRSIHFSPALGSLDGVTAQHRYLSGLENCFADGQAYAGALQQGDPLIYSVSAVLENQGDGQLHYVLAVLYPGKVGDEYYMTKGHIHVCRSAAEVYIGMKGRGLVLMEYEHSGESTAMPLNQDSIVYIPGSAAHRTINTGDEPLVYWCVLPSNAGADYDYVAKRNFREMIVEVDGQPRVVARAA